MNKETLAINDVKARKWIVGSLNAEGLFSISASPVRHDSRDSADREAARLASQNPGTAYIVMQLQGGRLVPKVIGVQSF